MTRTSSPHYKIRLPARTERPTRWPIDRRRRPIGPLNLMGQLRQRHYESCSGGLFWTSCRIRSEVHSRVCYVLLDWSTRKSVKFRLLANHRPSISDGLDRSLSDLMNIRCSEWILSNVNNSVRTPFPPISAGWRSRPQAKKTTYLFRHWQKRSYDVLSDTRWRSIMESTGRGNSLSFAVEQAAGSQDCETGYPSSDVSPYRSEPHHSCVMRNGLQYNTVLII